MGTFTVVHEEEKTNTTSSPSGELWLTPPYEPSDAVFSEAGPKAMALIRQYVADMDPQAKSRFWGLYRLYYGGRAAAGAQRSVSAWLADTVRLKPPTGNRVFKLAPAVMELSKRIEIFAAIVEFQFGIESQSLLGSVQITDENYEKTIPKVLHIIEQTPSRTSATLDLIHLPEGLSEYAKWLLSADMVLALRVLKKHLREAAVLRKNAALKDFKLFISAIPQQNNEGSLSLDLGDGVLLVSYAPSAKYLYSVEVDRRHRHRRHRATPTGFEMTDKTNITVANGVSSLTTKELLDSLPERERQDLAKFALQKRLELEAQAAETTQKQAQAYHAVQIHAQAFHDLRQQDSSFRSGHSIHQEINTGTGKMNISSHTGSSCFVATVAYRDAHHPDVEYLRRFRDQYLAKTRSGLHFIYWYYRKAGPKMADFVKGRPALRALTLALLKGLVGLLRIVCPTKQ